MNVSGWSSEKASWVLARIFDKCIRSESGCLLWQGATKNGGYGKINVDRKEYAVHRLVYETAHGQIGPEYVIRHLCHNKACCAQEHLEIGTQRDNMQDSSRSGLMAKTHRAFGKRLPKGTSIDSPRVLQTMMTRVKRADNGCLEWQGGLNQYGYGVVKVCGRYYVSHRLFWELQIGPIPEGKYLLHECDNRKCCEVGHLRLGTQQENLEDAKTRGRLRKGDNHPKAAPRGRRHYLRQDPEKAKAAVDKLHEWQDANRDKMSGENHWSRQNPERAQRVYEESGQRRRGKPSGLQGSKVGTSKLKEELVVQIREEYAAGAKQWELAEKYGVAQPVIGRIVTGKNWAHAGGPIAQRAETLRRATDHAKGKIGELNPSAKLTAETVRKIRELSREGWSQRKTAAEVGCHQTTVQLILAGKIWTQVQ